MEKRKQEQNDQKTIFTIGTFSMETAAKIVCMRENLLTRIMKTFICDIIFIKNI